MIIVRSPSPQDVPQSLHSLRIPQSAVPTTITITTGESKSQPTTASTLSTCSDLTATVIVARFTPNTSILDLGNPSMAPTTSSSASLVSSSSAQRLSTAVIIGITSGVVMCLVVIVSIACLACRLRRKGSPGLMVSDLLPHRYRRRQSRSSASLTSFDTTTEVGVGAPNQKEQLKLLLKDEQELFETLQDTTSIGEPTLTTLSNVNPSSTSLPYFTEPPLQQLHRQSASHVRRSCETNRPTSHPDKHHQSFYMTSAQGHVRSQSSSALPQAKPLHVPISTSHFRAASDAGTSCFGHRLSPIVDSPSSPSKPVMSSRLTPRYDSPHSLTAPILDTSMSSSPVVRGFANAQATGIGSLISSPMTSKHKSNLGPVLVSHRSKLPLKEYLGSKPLPPSPPAPPAPPPPFPPPVIPLMQQQSPFVSRARPPSRKNLDSCIGSELTRTPTQMGSSNLFQELLPPKKSVHIVTPLETSLRRYKRSHSITPITSLDKLPVSIQPLQSPKPVLRLNTSSTGSETYLHPRSYAVTATLNSGKTLTPVAAANNTPAAKQFQHEDGWGASPHSIVRSPGDLLVFTPRENRPVSITATAASTASPALSDDSGSFLDFGEYENEPVTPTQNCFQNPPVTVSAVIDECSLSASTSFLSTDPQELCGFTKFPESKVIRSPSISVPIVFRFPHPKNNRSRQRIR